MNTDISAIIVFIQGIISFLSPCVLPLIPVYIAYLAGNMEVSGAKRKNTLLINSIAFIAGFTVIFILMGATAGMIGAFLTRHNEIIRKIGAIVIIILGIHQTGIINIKFLNYEKRADASIGNTAPKVTKSLLIGMAFSFGWTPCIGPILSSVLILAGNQATVVRGAFLLFIYSMGMAIPFFIITFILGTASSRMKSMYRYMDTIKFISGILLIVLGIMVYTNYFFRLASIG